MYLFFVVVTSVCTVLFTIIVQRMNLHAESNPLVAMPAWVSIYRITPCPKKTCDHIFYNNFNNKCPSTSIFGAVSSKSMSHRKLVSFPTSPI